MVDACGGDARELGEIQYVICSLYIIYIYNMRYIMPFNGGCMRSGRPRAGRKRSFT